MAAQMPGDLRDRLQLANFLWTHRSQDAGWAEYERLAQLDAIGAAELHLWIARNAMSAQPFRRLTDQQLIRHLQQRCRPIKTTAKLTHCWPACTCGQVKTPSAKVICVRQPTLT